jgi:hypothetical protein
MQKAWKGHVTARIACFLRWYSHPAQIESSIFGSERHSSSDKQRAAGAHQSIEADRDGIYEIPADTGLYRQARNRVPESKARIVEIEKEITTAYARWESGCNTERAGLRRRFTPHRNQRVFQLLIITRVLP